MNQHTFSGARTFKSVKEVVDFRMKVAQRRIEERGRENLQGTDGSVSGTSSRTREGSIANPKSTCQERLAFAELLKSKFKTIPMPAKVRKMHKKLGDFNVDTSVPYVIKGQEKGVL